MGDIPSAWYGMTVDIDLGEIPPPSRTAPAAGPDDRPEPAAAARPAAAAARPFGIAAVAVALACTMVGSVPSPSLELRAAVSVAAAAFSFDGTSLYVLGAWPEGGVVAYEAADGASRWRMPAPERYRDLARVGDGVIVSGGDCPGPVGAAVTAVHRTSGAPLWRLPGRLVGALPGGATVVVERALGDQRCSTSSPSNLTPAQIAAFDLRTGRVAWSYDRPAAATVYPVTQPDGAIAALVTVAFDGFVQVRETTAGDVRATGRIDGLRLGSARSPFASQVLAAGDTLVVINRNGFAHDLTGYALDTLAPRWHRRDPGGTETADNAIPPTYFRCGPSSICAWVSRFERLPGVARTPTRLARLPAALMVVDPGSGALLRLVRGYRQLGRGPGESLLVGWGSPGGGTTFGLLDPPAGTVRVIGSAPGQYALCAVDSRHLACAAWDGLIRLWRTSG